MVTATAMALAKENKMITEEELRKRVNNRIKKIEKKFWPKKIIEGNNSFIETYISLLALQRIGSAAQNCLDKIRAERDKILKKYM